MVRLERVYAGFRRNPVFTDLSLDLRFGEHLALVGANGSGKSTLLSLLHGDLRPAQDLPERARPGKIYWYFEGVADPSPLTAREYARLVSPAQQRRLVRLGAPVTGREIMLSGLDNALTLYGAAAAGRDERATELAEAAGAEDILSLRLPAMSRGKLRLCLILRALMGRPRLLLLDEPFDGLDAEARRAAARGLELAAGRCTLIASAHRNEDIPPFMREMLLVRNGCVTRRTTGADASALPENSLSPRCADAHVLPEDIFSTQCADASGMTSADATINGLSPQCADASALPENIFSPQFANTPALQEDSTPPAAPEAFHNALPDSFAGAAASRGTPLLRLEHVNVFIEGCRVLHDIRWSVLPGEQWLISGPNGSGKSTLLRLLYGDEQAALGSRMMWRGGKRPGLEELRRNVGYVSDQFQDLYAYDLNAEETVISGLRGSIGLYGEILPDERERARFRLERMGVLHAAESPLYSLSTGNARRVMLARALAASPPVLLLDEPCSGLDAEGRALFFDNLRELARHGVTLICVSHHGDRTDLFTHELRLEKGHVLFAGPR
jgi:molybdate transport system ATP-binding protein